MRTNISIDDTLMADVLAATGIKTKREAVELGLKNLVDAEAARSHQGLQRQIKMGRRSGANED